MALVLFISLAPNYKSFKAGIGLGILGLALLFAELSGYLNLYNGGHYQLFGEVYRVYSQHDFFSIDHNSSWRILFWYRLLVVDFPQNLLGIGIGTPMLPYIAGVSTQALGHPDEYIAHVIGAHNTFITFFYRFGIGCVILFAIIYRLVFKEFYNFKNYYLNNKNDISLFLGFIKINFVIPEFNTN